VQVDAIDQNLDFIPPCAGREPVPVRHDYSVPVTSRTRGNGMSEAAEVVKRMLRLSAAVAALFAVVT
jgi:hypothetical protein